MKWSVFQSGNVPSSQPCLPSDLSRLFGSWAPEAEPGTHLPRCRSCFSHSRWLKNVWTWEPGTFPESPSWRRMEYWSPSCPWWSSRVPVHKDRPALVPGWDAVYGRDDLVNDIPQRQRPGWLCPAEHPQTVLYSFLGWLVITSIGLELYSFLNLILIQELHRRVGF